MENLVEVFATCYNEEIILPYFLKHYSQFTTKITVYDNMSTDNSVNIMKSYGVNVIPFDTKNKFEESRLMDIRNNCWKKSNAKWVIVCDCDELIYNTNLVNILKNINATHIITEGYQMMSEVLPSTNGQIYDEIKQGFLIPDYSKPCVFKPNEIKEINFAPGSHTAKPTGNVVSVNNSGLKLLHYKYINRSILINKYKNYAIRQSEEMKKKGWGNYQQWTESILNNQFDTWFKQCKNVIEDGSI